MRKIDELIKNHYDGYDEEGRFSRDRAHSIEFITSKKYIEKYLNKGDKILEVGAGTGRYSIYFAEKGYDVTSVELLDKHLNILKSKINDDMKINAIKGNALDLSCFKDNSFDITLVLGPLYHLYDENEILQAINEAIRVTKKGGKIFLAYITQDAVILSYGVRKKNLKRLYNELIEDNWKVKNLPEEIFSSFRISEFNDILAKIKGISTIEEVGVDGNAMNMIDYINDLDDEEFDIYMDYHLNSCMRKDLIGYSTHILNIIEKE